MMDADDYRRREKTERRAAEERDRHFRADMQEIMETPAARRVVWAFLQAAGMDGMAYRDNAHDMLVASAMQDNARWWVAHMREHCPEREVQMRVEARKAEKASEATTTDEGNEDGPE